MSTPTIVVLIAVVPVTLLAFALLGVSVTRRTRRALREAERSYERIEPYLERLQADAEVARRETARLESSYEVLQAARAERRRTR